jgi:hypothetical protein
MLRGLNCDFSLSCHTWIDSVTSVIVKGKKVKVHPRTGHGGPEGE